MVAAFREQLLGHVVAVVAGRLRLLDALDQGRMPWGIVANGSAGQLRKVRKLGLAGRAACVVVSEMLGARKPAPEIFHAAARLGVHPRETLFVGDNPGADVVGAARAGMRAAWLHRGREWSGHLAASARDHTIASLADLLDSSRSVSVPAPEPDCPHESTRLHSAAPRAPSSVPREP